MNDTLATLAQFIEPEPVPFSFAAPGWYVLGAVQGLLLLLCVVLFCRHYYKNRYRREAIKQLKQQVSPLLEQKQYADILYAANMVMKQIGIARYGREAMAPLQGFAWLQALNKSSSSTLFDTNDAQLLTAMYFCDIQLNANQVNRFVAKAIQWIKKHKYVVERHAF